MPSTTRPPPSPNTSSKNKHAAGLVIGSALAGITGLVCVLGVFVLIGVGRMDAAAGLPWIVATLSGLGVVQAHNGRR